MTSPISPLLIGGLGGVELLIILAVLVLLFGASKLPELARGGGQALRIFKAETKGLMDDDEKPSTTARDKAAAAAPVIDPVATPVSATVLDPLVDPVTAPVETPRGHDATRG